ncbi:MAG: hypothetical protein LWX83_19580 [Anaerolineae bacterium]|nr:hypothetical protein [Anaerolineae bacterium]
MKPLELIKASMKYWWMLVVFMVVGAGVGYVINLTSTPIYEARTIFNISIDYAITGKLTDIEEDQALVAVGDVFNSSEVMDKTLSTAKQNGIQISPEAFRKSTFVEHTNSEWVLRVRHTQPEVASQLVNIWSDQANLVIGEGLKHANLANWYYRRLESLSTCVENVAAVEPAGTVCGFASMDELLKNMSATSFQASEELTKSRDLSAATLVSWNNRSESNGEVVSSGRGVSMILGAGIGFILFIFANGLLLLTQKP